MPRFSFAVGNSMGTAPASHPDVPTFTGFPAEASTLFAVVVIEAALMVALRHFFRHSHGG